MATAQVNGIGLSYERNGAGEPVVLVHGGLVDRTSWATAYARPTKAPAMSRK